MARVVVNVDVRSLRRLHEGASTSRVLNLLRLWEEADRARRPLDTPFFSTQALNRAFFVKHRLRGDETFLFADGRTTATKVLLPVDPDDLKAGGRFLFIGQDEWLESLTDAVGARLTDRPDDMKLLRILDALPAFDPFILREQMRRHGLCPDPRYFALQSDDVAHMESFVAEEIAQLVSLSLGGAAAPGTVRNLLSMGSESELEPLRRTLRLRPEEFGEAMFCWRGFLYYKWVCVGMEAEILCAMREMQERMPRSRPGQSTEFDSLEQARRRLGRNLMMLFSRATEFIAGYDEAYAVLVNAENPRAFRHFLLSSPVLFLQLGEVVGMIEHTLKFWRYRCERQISARMPAREFSELVHGFDDDLYSIAA